jgi:hypothetical protein
MRKLLLCLFTLFTVTGVISQTNKTVDEKNGFLEFKFGKKPSDLKGKIEKIPANIQNNNTDRYKVTSPDYKKVFGYEVKSIELEFFKNQLYAITIDFVNETDDISYGYVQYKLQDIFGESSANIEPESSDYLTMLKGEAWKGSKSILYLHKMKIKSSSKIFASLYYKNKQIEKQMETTEF